MATTLSDRQQQLLKALVELYVKNGEPVSSDLVEKVHNLGVSPATIRNEMVRLTDLGYLKQPHVSAGRVPTAIGFRTYINELMQSKDIPVMDEVMIKQQILDTRAEFDKTLQAATRALAKKLNTLALAVEGKDIYYTGAAHMLDVPEFFDIDVTRFVLSMFDEFALIEQLISIAHGPEPFHIVFGEETGFEYLRPTSFAFMDFEDPLGQPGIIGVFGPNRLNFPVVFPYLKYVGEVLEEAGGTLK